MKRNIFLFIFMLCIIEKGVCKESGDNYLISFFSSSEYITKRYQFDNETILFSFVYSDNSNEIIAKGIFYTYDDNKFKSYLIIDNETIYNNSKILFQGIIQTQKFYGYRINVVEINKCVTTVFCTDLGEHVTEGPIFLWDSKLKVFTNYEIDRSQF